MIIEKHKISKYRSTDKRKENFILFYFLSLPEDIFWLLLERGCGGGGERERQTDRQTDRHGCDRDTLSGVAFSYTLGQGLSLHPGCVPWQGIEPVDDAPTNRATPARPQKRNFKRVFFKMYLQENGDNCPWKTIKKIKNKINVELKNVFVA